MSTHNPALVLCQWLLFTPALVLQLHIDPQCGWHMNAMPTSSRRLFSAWMDSTIICLLTVSLLV
jgi:hypothetical protein